MSLIIQPQCKYSLISSSICPIIEDVPLWYKNLCSYFPPKEMKSIAHIIELKKKYGDNYKIESDENSVVIYFESDFLIFVEYLLVTSTKRGNGIGSMLLDKLKGKNKLIILEVESPDDNTPYTKKRINFYKKNAFIVADWLSHHSNNLFSIDNGDSKLNIMIWSPSPYHNKHFICETVKYLYDTIHTFKYELFYNKKVQDVNIVIKCCC